VYTVLHVVLTADVYGGDGVPAGGSLLVNNPPKVSTDSLFTMACPGSVTMHSIATDDDGDDIKYIWDLTTSTGAHNCHALDDKLAVP
jgi:hypothetical protein